MNVLRKCASSRISFNYYVQPQEMALCFVYLFVWGGGWDFFFFSAWLAGFLLLLLIISTVNVESITSSIINTYMAEETLVLP